MCEREREARRETVIPHGRGVSSGGRAIRSGPEPRRAGPQHVERAEKGSTELPPVNEPPTPVDLVPVVEVLAERRERRLRVLARANVHIADVATALRPAASRIDFDREVAEQVLGRSAVVE